jgi:hypothetical protein
MKDLANIGVEQSTDGTQVFADVANVRKLRQIVDTTIGKDFAFTDLDKSNRAAQKELANGIRTVFGEQYPNIAKLNKDFHFWKSAVDVLSAAIERKTGQTGLIRTGIVVGLGMAAPTGHPYVGAVIGKLLSDFVTSPVYHTVTAAVKSKIADAIEKADYVGAQKLIQIAMGSIPGIGAGLVTRTPITSPSTSFPMSTPITQ